MARRSTTAALFGTVLLLGACAATANPDPEPNPQRWVELLEEYRAAAIEQVQASARSEDPFVRMNAIEAMLPLPELAAELIEAGLADEHPGVRFAALVTAGRLELERFGDEAVALSQADERAVVRAAAMFAAHQAGREVDISELARMLAAEDPSLRANAAMLLGLMDDDSAIPMMRELAHRPMPRVASERQALMRLQVAEAMARLGDEDALGPIRAAGWSNFDEVRVLGVSIMGQLEDYQMKPAIGQILRQRPDGQHEPIELRVAAAEALARMGSNDGFDVMLEAAGATEDSRLGGRVGPEQLAAVRAQAAHALGWVQTAQAAEKLGELLEDDSAEPVRLSAAAAVLKALEPIE